MNSIFRILTLSAVLVSFNGTVQAAPTEQTLEVKKDPLQTEVKKTTAVDVGNKVIKQTNKKSVDNIDGSSATSSKIEVKDKQ